LHSYGFTDTGAEYLLNFVIGQLVLLGNGTLDCQAWRSFQPSTGLGLVRLFRPLLGLLDVVWLLAAILWFGGVFSHQHVIWFGGVYQTLPWLEFAGKTGSFSLLFLVWILAGISRFALVSRGSPRTSLAAAASSVAK
jgi:hypothetical protein